MKERKLRSISPRKYNTAIRNNNQDLIFLKARGPNMWQFLCTSTAIYLCVWLLQVVDLQGSRNVSSGYALKKINNFVLQTLGEKQSLPSSFAFSTQCQFRIQFTPRLQGMEGIRHSVRLEIPNPCLDWPTGEDLNGWGVKEWVRRDLKEFFSCRELGVSCGVVFCHNASPQRQEQPAGSQEEKWLKNWFFFRS